MNTRSIIPDTMRAIPEQYSLLDSPHRHYAPGLAIRHEKDRAGDGGHVFWEEQGQIFAENETRITFADVAGIDEAKEELQEVVEFLKNPGKFQKLGGRIPKGVLLVARQGRAKPFWPRPWPGRQKCLFSASAGLSLWRCSSAWEQRASRSFLSGHEPSPLPSSSSMNWTR